MARHLQLCKSYKGTYRIENIENIWNITTQLMIQIKNEPIHTDKCNHFIVKFHSYVQFPYEKDFFLVHV